jgi:Protein of unknown function (DUF4239)
VIALAAMLGGAVVGMFLRAALPEHQVSAETKDVLRLGTGLITLIAALVLGLLIASAKSAYDTQSSQVREITTNIILTDLLLARYGPETHTARDLLRRLAVVLADKVWREQGSGGDRMAPYMASEAGNVFNDKLQELSPSNEAQRSLKARAIQISTDSIQARLRLFAQADNSIPMPFLVMLIFWLAMIFASFCLFARPNAVVIGALLVFAFSAAGSIFLILELGQPFEGLMQIPSDPLRHALAPLSPA